MEQAAPSGVRPASAAPRLAQLDVLRAVAIFLVIGHHAAVDREQAGVLWPLYVWFKNFGWTGVDLFFVLSGFLIGGLLFRELRTRHTLDVRRFLLRRGFKIWPAYYVYLAFCLAVLVGLGHHGIGQALRLLGPNLVHLQNYSSILLDPHAKGLLPLTSHTWTLAIEEHFYLALALFLGLITRRQRTFDAGLPLVPVAAAVVMLGCLAARIWLVWGAAVTDVYYLYRPTHL
ncbi:MAG: acyltransferase, partial [Armatimonadetes bacterium]|nr:acyltransferase [Armatimonadota bacterium]